MFVRAAAGSNHQPYPRALISEIERRKHSLDTYRVVTALAKAPGFESASAIRFQLRLLYTVLRDQPVEGGARSTFRGYSSRKR